MVVRIPSYSSRFNSEMTQSIPKCVNDVILFESYVTNVFIQKHNLVFSKFIQMKPKNEELKRSDQQTGNKEENDFQGYPLYPDSEDIYNNSQEEKDINPEDTSNMKESDKRYKVGTTNEKYLTDDASGNNLDIPGAELDDEQEDIGGEDEENNYYSLGGEDHDDLEEDKGE